MPASPPPPGAKGEFLALTCRRLPAPLQQAKAAFRPLTFASELGESLALSH